MSGRRRDYSGVASGLNILSQGLGRKMELDYENQQDEAKWQRRLKEAGLLKGIEMGEVDPLTLERRSAPTGLLDTLKQLQDSGYQIEPTLDQLGRPTGYRTNRQSPKEQLENEIYRQTLGQGRGAAAPIGTATPVADQQPSTGGRLDELLRIRNQISGEAWKPLTRQESLDYDLEKRRLESEQDLKEKSRRDLDVYASDALQMLGALNKIEQEAKSLGDFPRGAFGQTISRLQAGYGTYSKEKEITRYIGAVSQELIPAARKLMEEKGPITSSDVERVEKGLGDITTPLEDKIYLINLLRSKVRKSLKSKQGIAGFDDPTFSQRYGELSSSLSLQDQGPSMQIPGDTNEQRIGRFLVTVE